MLCSMLPLAERKGVSCYSLTHCPLPSLHLIAATETGMPRLKFFAGVDVIALLGYSGGGPWVMHRKRM